jgi:hypothetical protein
MQGAHRVGGFPPDEAIVQRLSRGLQPVAKKWTQPMPEWKAALKPCVMLFGERVPRGKNYTPGLTTHPAAAPGNAQRLRCGEAQQRLAPLHTDAPQPQSTPV